MKTIYSLISQDSTAEHLPKVLVDPKFYITRCAHFERATSYLAYSSPIRALHHNLREADEECKIVSLVMLKCLRGAEHEVGGVIVDMPGLERAQAVLTFERTCFPDESVVAYKPFGSWPAGDPKPLEEIDVITTYKLSKSNWSPRDLVELFQLDPTQNNTEKHYPHPHIPDRKSTTYACIYSIDFATHRNPPTFTDLGAVLSLVSDYRLQYPSSLVNSCSFFVGVVFKIMQSRFRGSEVKFNKNVRPFASYPPDLIYSAGPTTCALDDAVSKWFNLEHPGDLFSWFGSTMKDFFRIINDDNLVLKSIVDELASQVPAAVEALAFRRDKRERAREEEEERKRAEEHENKIKELQMLITDERRKGEEERQKAEKEQREWMIILEEEMRQTAEAKKRVEDILRKMEVSQRV